MKAPKHYPLVMVHWRDAWHSVEDLPHDELGGLCDLWEVGFLVVDTAEAVVLCMEMDEDGTQSSRNTLTIPKVNIVEIAPLYVRSLSTKTARKRDQTTSPDPTV